MNGPYGSVLPQKESIKILHSSSLANRNVFGANGEFDNADTTWTLSEITTSYLNPDRTVGQTIRVRKTGDELFYLREVNQSEGDPLKFAGYCYRENRPQGKFP